jgi:hypothetical protein
MYTIRRFSTMLDNLPHPDWLSFDVSAIPTIATSPLLAGTEGIGAGLLGGLAYGEAALNKQRILAGKQRALDAIDYDAAQRWTEDMAYKWGRNSMKPRVRAAAALGVGGGLAAGATGGVLLGQHSQQK